MEVLAPVRVHRDVDERLGWHCPLDIQTESHVIEFLNPMSLIEVTKEDLFLAFSVDEKAVHLFNDNLIVLSLVQVIINLDDWLLHANLSQLLSILGEQTHRKKISLDDSPGLEEVILRSEVFLFILEVEFALQIIGVGKVKIHYPQDVGVDILPKSHVKHRLEVYFDQERLVKLV